MSHYIVMLALSCKMPIETEPTFQEDRDALQETIREALAPYHEFETTGRNEYIQEIDRLEEAMEEYNSREVDMIVDADGNTHSYYDESGNFLPQYWREPTEEEIALMPERSPFKSVGTIGDPPKKWRYQRWGNRAIDETRVFELPKGWREAKVAYSSMFSFIEFLRDEYDYDIILEGEEPDIEGKHKWGYAVRSATSDLIVRVVRRTNPNDKWDWYAIGGRWSGYFPVLKGSVGLLGEPGFMSPRAKDDHYDIVQKKDIDRAVEQEKVRKECELCWNLATGAWGGREFKTWEEIFAEYGKERIDEARKVYHDQEPVAAFEKMIFEEHNRKHFSFMESLEEYTPFTLEEYTEPRVRAALKSFAYLDYRDPSKPVWAEKGEMLMFGVVADEKKPEDWTDQFNEWYESLPDDTVLVAVDCHI